MIRVRKAGERGHYEHGWLDTWHSFSFADYYDPEHMGFRALRVINEDRVAPAQGFPEHGHRDMEIVTYVLAGELAHRDSLGNGSVLRPGEVQRMSAGTGVRHSEFNPSHSQLLHLLQIWILPERTGLAPEYEQKAFERRAERREGSPRWQVLVAPDGRDGAVRIHQDVTLSLAELREGERLARALDPARHAWLQVAHGALALGELRLDAGDGVALSGERELTLLAEQPSEVLLFDLA